MTAEASKLPNPTPNNCAAGLVTTTVTLPAMPVMTPGICAETVVVPAVSGSNAKPPETTVEGECALPAAIVTVCVPAEPDDVFNVPTVARLLLTVAVIENPPRTTWFTNATSFPAVLARSTMRVNGWSADSVVVAVGTPLRRRAVGATATVSGLSGVNRFAVAVRVVVAPIAPSA